MGINQWPKLNRRIPQNPIRSFAQSRRRSAAAAFRAACDNHGKAERELKVAEKAMNQAGDRDCISADLLVDVVPTTRQGLFALIQYLAEATERDPHQLGDQRLNAAILNIGKAMRELKVTAP
jgi:hypothetical protein